MWQAGPLFKRLVRIAFAGIVNFVLILNVVWLAQFHEVVSCSLLRCRSQSFGC